MHKNKINGKMYIGQTCQKPEKRWNEGRGYKTGVFSKAIEKYGWENFEHIILETGLTGEEADNRERYYIQKYHTWIQDEQCNGYNSEKGGNLQKQLSEETKRKISESRKGEKHWNYGKHLSEETRRKISEANKGKKKSPELIERMRQSRLGKKNSPEARRKISEALKGHPGWNKGRQVSQETKDKISNTLKQTSPLKKRVLCITTGKEFESITAGANYYNSSKTGLSQHLNGRTKSSGKDPETGERLVWKFI